MKKLLCLVIICLMLAGCSRLTPDSFLATYNKRCEERSAIKADAFQEQDGVLQAQITKTSGLSCTVDKNGEIESIVYTADLKGGDINDVMGNWSAFVLTFESVENAKIVMNKFTPLYNNGQPINRDVSFTFNGREYMTIPTDDDYLVFGTKGAN